MKNRVDAINTFPEETEKPVIKLSQRVRSVISIVISGELEEAALRRLGEQVRDEVLTNPEITQAELKGVRGYEIGIEVAENTLQKYNFTLGQVLYNYNFRNRNIDPRISDSGRPALQTSDADQDLQATLQQIEAQTGESTESRRILS